MSAPQTRQIQSLLAANLRLAREESGLSIAALADAVEAHPRLTLKWLQGDVMPSARYLPRLAEALDRELGWFYTDHGVNGEAA